VAILAVSQVRAVQQASSGLVIAFSCWHFCRGAVEVIVAIIVGASAVCACPPNLVAFAEQPVDLLSALDISGLGGPEPPKKAELLPAAKPAPSPSHSDKKSGRMRPGLVRSSVSSCCSCLASSRCPRLVKVKLFHHHMAHDDQMPLFCELVLLRA
jgi:hypothetical protein